MPKAPTKGRVRLDAQTIIDAGLEIAAVPGAASVSVRELGARLGADPTAIYRHFRSKDDLMAALLDELHTRAVAEVTAPAEDWVARLRELALGTLAQFTRYPAIGSEATTLTTHGPGEAAAIELMLAAFGRAGLVDRELVEHYALMAAHILSSAAGIARAGAGDAGFDRRVSPWLDAPLMADPRAFPLIAAHSALLNALQDEELYLRGVDTIIDSARRSAA